MRFHKAFQVAFSIVMMSMAGSLAPASAQNQQDYCIKCTNPGETYICRIVSNSGSAKGKQLLCIMNIAKENGHDSCAATTQSQTCSGVLVQYEALGGANGQNTSPQANTDQAPNTPMTTSPAPNNPALPQTKPKSEPRTLVEFTKQATKATKKGINSAGKDTSKAFKKTGKKITKFSKNVGKNITKASKTTWKCITSLFFSCGSN